VIGWLQHLNVICLFDQFIVHQMAGDLLPSPEHQEFYADGLIATTFLTNGRGTEATADRRKWSAIWSMTDRYSWKGVWD